MKQVTLANQIRFTIENHYKSIGQICDEAKIHTDSLVGFMNKKESLTIDVVDRLLEVLGYTTVVLVRNPWSAIQKEIRSADLKSVGPLEIGDK